MSKAKIIMFLSVAMLIAGAVATHAASGDRIWAKIYNTSNTKTEQATAIGVDSSGSVYITGRSGSNYMTTKYRSDGTRKWTRLYVGPGGRAYANDLAVQDRNIIVTGASKGNGTGLDYATIKYRRSGGRAWVKRYDGPAHLADIAKAVTADTSGNVYVTGGSRRLNRNYDYATIKYGPNGKRLWVRRYDGTAHGRDIANAVSVDTSGNVVVTGRSARSNGSVDYVTIKYNSSGVKQWAKRYNGPNNGFDEARGLSIDTTGNIFVTGSSDGTSTGRDYATVMYDTSGTQQWVSRYNGQGTGTDLAVAISLDSTGLVYVTGTSESTSTANNYATIKYDTTGTQQWVTRYDGSSSLADSASALTIDTTNNIFVTGTSNDSTGSRIATLKYDSDGAQQWARRYRPTQQSFFSGSAIAVDNNGLYIAGNRLRFGNNDAVTLKYER